MAKLRVKAPDGKTLVIEVPAGTDPSQYDGLATAALAHYQENAGNATADYWRGKGDYPAAGEEKPPEQKAAEMLVEIGNTAGAVSALPGMVKGAVGLGLKGAGAISEGLAPTMEKAGNWFGSRVLNFGRSTLPKSATKAGEMVDEAAEYAMNPHPEVQKAIRSIDAINMPEKPTLALPAEGESMGQSLVKAGGTPPPEPMAPGVMGDKGQILDEAVNSLNDPILSMSNMTTSSQLTAAESHLGTVGKAIENTLDGLTETGNMYDPKATVEKLASMYQRNASGSIIPPGAGSEQAMYNAAVNKAIETLKANALDDSGILQKLDWKQANGIKKALQDLADYGLKDNDPVNMVYQNAARTVRDTIDDQAAQVLAAQGKDISHFQTLRDAYSKLKMVQSGLNGKALSAMGAKNVAPVVRTALGVGALTTGHPLVAAGVGAEYIGREFGPILAARGLNAASKLPAAASAAGRTMTEASGGVSNAAKGIAAGLAADINDEE